MVSRRLSGLLLGCACALAAPAAADESAAGSPQQRLEAVSTRLLEGVRARAGEFGDDRPALDAFVRATLEPVLDDDRILRIILGKRHYAAASAAQRAEFAESLKRQLIRLYAETILTYSAGKVRYLPFELDPDKRYQLVRTEFLLSGRAPVDLSYLMRAVGGEWRVFEVRADGIFLIRSLRDSLRPEIDQNGLEAVIERLRSGAAGASRRTAAAAAA